jgi:conjugative transposon TraJ protein
MNVGSIVEKITTKVEPFSEQVGMLMSVICGVGALLYIGSKVWKNMSSGEPVDVFPLLRPFVIGFFVLNFSLVKAPVDFLIERAERLSYGYFEKTFGSITEQAEKVQEKVQADAKARKAKEKQQWDEMMQEKKGLKKAFEYLKEGLSYVGKAAAGVMSTFDGFISTAVTSILQLLLYAFKSVLIWYYKYMSIIYRCILGILGPIAFTVSIFPGFSNGITSWLSKYVAICLWPAVFGIINYLIVSIQTELICGIDFSQWWEVGTALSMAEWQSILLTVIEIAAYLTVPTIVGWIIPNGDAGGALSGMKSVLSVVTSAVGAAVGAAIGGAAAGKAMAKKMAK